jgi:hypothetical protein
MLACTRSLPHCHGASEFGFSAHRRRLLLFRTAFFPVVEAGTSLSTTMTSVHDANNNVPRQTSVPLDPSSSLASDTQHTPPPEKSSIDLEAADDASLSGPPPLSPARLRIIFACLGLTFALAGLESTIVSTATASISSDLGGGEDQASICSASPLPTLTCERAGSAAPTCSPSLLAFRSSTDSGELLGAVPTADDDVQVIFVVASFCSWRASPSLPSLRLPAPSVRL